MYIIVNYLLIRSSDLCASFYDVIYSYATKKNI